MENKCKRCNEFAVKNRKFCKKHLERFKELAAIKRNNCKTKNLCKDCYKPKESKEKSRCDKCCEKNNIKFKQRCEKHKIDGKCVICGEFKKNKRASYCNKCAMNDKKRQKEKRIYCKKNKLCYKCDCPSIGGKILCFNCNLENSIRKNIITALKKKVVPKSARTEELLGCSIDFFREHMKNLMADWMNEDNYGVHIPGERRWQIGHRRPVASFDLVKVEDQKKCWHYTNLFPQEASENIMLGDLMVFEGTIIRGRHYLIVDID